MNYYKPLEIADENDKGTGKWRMTVTHDHESFAVGYCMSMHEHSSPEEASDCYRDFITKECNGILPGGFKLENVSGARGTVLNIASSY